LVFLNLLMAAGLAAVSAPILIHLLHRSKVVPHDWGAMMFLEELVAERARRLRMHELILLIVRALIVACLALAMMRPVIKWASAGVRAPGVHSSVVILLDDSYSMSAGRPKSAWLEARELALRYVDTLRPGDDATVVFTSSAGKGLPPAALFDHERVREIIREAAPRFERADMPTVLGAALQILETRHNPQRELVIFSDMQAEGWELQDGARWSFLGTAIRSSRLKPNVILAAVSERRPPNAALTNLFVSRAVVDSFTPVGFHLTVKNGGGEPLHGVNISFAVDGAPKVTRTVDLPLNAREILAFEHKFDRPGSHHVSFRVRAAQEALDADDEWLHSVLVIDRLPVLLVDGDRHTSPLAGETGFLRLALSPRDQEDPGWRTVIEPSVVEPSDLRYQDLSKFKVIVLANVAALPGAAVSELERFVVGGGGLFLALGDRVQLEAYNRDLYRQGGGLLPVPLERVEGLPAAEAAKLVAGGPGEGSAGKPVHFGHIVSDAPALELFRPEKGQDWSKATIRNFVQAAAGTGKEEVRTLATFSNGAPALIQKKMGEGKVVLLTTALDTGWSDLPVHPFYVPLMQSLVLDLASAVIPPRNIRVGQVLSYVSSGEAARRPHVLTPPRSEPLTLKPQAQGSLSIFSHAETGTPGLYTLVPEGAPPEDRTHYAVSADRRESELARLTEEHFLALERDLGARRAHDWSELARLIGLDAGGYEISKYLIVAALALCFVELYLTRRWS